MMFDATEELLGDLTEDTEKSKEGRFGFRYLAEKVIERQQDEKDCIFIISGDRRMGKSTWGLKLIRQYIILRRAAKDGFKWSWSKNFPLNRTAAQEAAILLPKRSFIFYDEGGDQFYRQETTKKAQRELVKFMNKSGSKKHLTIICWPDLFTLDPKILNMAQMLIIVPYRAGRKCAWAFLYGRSNNPFNYDKFGVEKIRKRLLSPTKGHARFHIPSLGGKTSIIYKGKEIVVDYPRELFKFLRSMPTFMKSHRFGPLEKEFERQYIRKVKDPQLASREEEEYINITSFRKLEQQNDVLLYNLYTKDEKSYAQLERLHISPQDGTYLRSAASIKRAIEKIRSLL